MKLRGDYTTISAGIVRLLVQRGYSLTRIANMLGLSKSYISRVHSGQRSLTLDHLTLLERKTGEPLPFLFLKSIPIKSVAPELRPLYRAAWKMAKPDKPAAKVRRRKKAA